MAGDEGPEGGLGLIPLLLRLMRIDGAGIEHLAGAVHDGHFDARAEARVQAEGRSGARRCGEQEVSEVSGEHLHRVQLGPLPQPHAGVDGSGDHQLDPPRQPHGGGQPRRRSARRGQVDAQRLGHHHLVFLVPAAVEADRQDLFLLPTHDGEHPVRRHRLERFGVFEIVTELLPRGASRHLLGLRRSPHRAGRPELLPNGTDELGVLGRPLDDDVAGSVECGGDVGHGLPEERCADGLRHERRIGQQLVGQRFEAGLTRNLRLGAPLGLVGQVDVLEPGLAVGRHYGSAQLVGELALLLDAGQHRGLALVQFAQILQALGERT